MEGQTADGLVYCSIDGFESLGQGRINSWWRNGIQCERCRRRSAAAFFWKAASRTLARAEPLWTGIAVNLSTQIGPYQLIAKQ